jgi:DNA-directed RNA polymerase sigma subunit (sigma70/sigma32)
MTLIACRAVSLSTLQCVCGCRGDGEIAHLRVLKHTEQYRLLGIVQRCSSHSVEYASPDPSPGDVKRVAQCLNTSPTIARTILDQARRARALLIRFSMRLCASLARKYARSGGVDFHTLLSEACAGLSEAIDRFDRSRDMKFTTYATHWVLRNVRRCVVDEARQSPVQLPPHIHYRLAKLLKIKTDVLANAPAASQGVFESDPDALNAAIAKAAGCSVETVRTLRSG